MGHDAAASGPDVAADMAGRNGSRPILLSAIGFVVPVSLAPAWIAFHPEMLQDTLSRYGTSEQPRAGVLQTYLSLIDPTSLVRKRRSEPDDVDREIGFCPAARRALTGFGSCGALATPRLDGDGDRGWPDHGANSGGI